MKEKKELLMNFKVFLSQWWKCFLEEIRSLCDFSYLKVVKLEPAYKVQSFFSERDPFSARKTSLFISITLLIIME
jgi:hypothetical protein